MKNRGLVVLVFLLSLFILVACKGLPSSVPLEDFSGPLKVELASFVPGEPLFYLAWEDLVGAKILGLTPWQDFFNLSFWDEAGQTRQLLRLGGWLEEVGEKLAYSFGENDLELILKNRGALAFYDLADMKMVLLLELNKQTRFFLDVFQKEIPQTSGWYCQQYAHILAISNDEELFRRVSHLRNGTEKSLRDRINYRQTVSALGEKPLVLAYMDYELIGSDPYFQRYWLGDPLPLTGEFLAYGASLKEEGGLFCQEFHLKAENSEVEIDWKNLLKDWEMIWQRRSQGASFWEVRGDILDLPGTELKIPASWLIHSIIPAEPLWGEVYIYKLEEEINWLEICTAWQESLAQVYGLERLPLENGVNGLVALDLPFTKLAPALARQGDYLFWSSNRTILTELLNNWPPELKCPKLPAASTVSFWNLQSYSDRQGALVDVWQALAWPSYQSRNLALNVLGGNQELLEKLDYCTRVAYPSGKGFEVRSKLYYR